MKKDENRVAELSPVMQQYLRIKEAHRDYILFFRMGDFYEMFMSDAILASGVLGIILTRKIVGGGKEIEMCGVPVHSYESYLNRLIKRGYSVAICDQLETPEEAKKRGYKSIVNRDVVRIITPGTIIEEALLEQSSYNYLAAVVVQQKKVALAWIDISSGDFYVESFAQADLNSALNKILPKEILISDSMDKELLFEDFRLLTTVVGKNNFEKKSCLDALQRVFDSKALILDSLEEIEKIACGIILQYVELTQKSVINVSLPKKDYSSTYLRMDSFTRRSLEINQSYSGEKEGSLREAMDYTLTPQGSRLLGQWINNPLKDIKQIEERLLVVDFFVSNPEVLQKLRNSLQKIGDVERAIGRIVLNKGSVLDLGVLRTCFKTMIEIRGVFFRQVMPGPLENLLASLGKHGALYHLLEEKIIPGLSIAEKETGFLNPRGSLNYNQARERHKELLLQVSHLQEKYTLKLNIPNLKILNTAVAGFFIETPLKHAVAISTNSHFKHKSTNATTVRYTTDELRDLEGHIAKTLDLIDGIEKDILRNLFAEIVKEREALQLSAKVIANLDVFASFASFAIDMDLVRPSLDTSNNLFIKEGRHIVVQKRLKELSATSFVPNDCFMDNNKNIFLISGPNMSGKSTFLRQNAVIIIIAQIGSFVPAREAKIGVVDSIFSRVGASDDLFKGQSTFMVEMIELATILNYATANSFLILDEIGRGTSTYDGLSIAYATLEYINSTLKAKSLFATHYHELTSLEGSLDKLECYYVKVIEERNKIVFMHSLHRGVSGKSYGIEVAKMAGLPDFVIKRARTVLAELEEKSKRDLGKQELPLFACNYNANNLESGNQDNLSVDYKKLVDEIEILDVDNLTPKEALEIIYRLHALCKAI